MKYVLRNQSTGRYLKRVGQWVRRVEDAMTFDDMVEVREYCQAHRLDGLQPVRRFMPYLASLLRVRAARPASGPDTAN
jgi:hypothetical protein